MNTFICLLRGINVGGHKKIKMADLRAILESLGFKNVQSYIQSGNIVFQHDTYSCEQLKAIIENKIEHNYSFHVKCFVYSLKEFQKLVNTNEKNPDKINPEIMAYIFLSQAPTMDKVEVCRSYINEDEIFWHHQNMIYFIAYKGFARAKMTTNFFESKLKVDTSSRNFRTVNKLIEIAQNL